MSLYGDLRVGRKARALDKVEMEGVVVLAVKRKLWRSTHRNALQRPDEQLKDTPSRTFIILHILPHPTKMTKLLTRLQRHYEAILDARKQIKHRKIMTRDVIYREEERRS